MKVSSLCVLCCFVRKQAHIHVQTHSMQCRTKLQQGVDGRTSGSEGEEATGSCSCLYFLLFFPPSSSWACSPLRRFLLLLFTSSVLAPGLGLSGCCLGFEVLPGFCHLHSRSRAETRREARVCASAGKLSSTACSAEFEPVLAACCACCATSASVAASAASADSAASPKRPITMWQRGWGLV